MESRLLTLQAINLLNTNQTGLAQKLDIDKGLVSRWMNGYKMRYCYVLALYGLLCKELGQQESSRFMGHVLRG